MWCGVMVSWWVEGEGVVVGRRGGCHGGKAGRGEQKTTCNTQHNVFYTILHIQHQTQYLIYNIEHIL